jgi:hypothetical protein
VAKEIGKESVYEFFDEKAGKPYVGQTGRGRKRLLEHIRDGRLLDGAEVRIRPVPGGRDRRRDIEQEVMESLGGKKDGTSNKINARRRGGKSRP